LSNSVVYFSAALSVRSRMMRLCSWQRSEKEMNPLSKISM
jgi:hypothetical protein